MKSLKLQAAERLEETKQTIRNFIEFLDAACLTAVSGYSIYEALQHRGYWYKGLLLAGVVIALQAAKLFVRHFNHGGVPHGARV